MNHKGIPDEQRSARCIIKDYLNGKLIYCYSPPGFDEKSFQQFKINTVKEEKYMERLKKIEAHVSKINQMITKAIVDEDYRCSRKTTQNPN
jgi:hypothetical protein